MTPQTAQISRMRFHHPARNPRRDVVAFGLWDWGTSAFSSVILTFVFSAYITSGVGAAGVTGEAAVKAATDSAAATLSFTQMWGAIAIALLAPLLGGLADKGGHRNTFLRLFTILMVVTVALMPLVAPDRSHLLFGCVLIAVALVFSELAGVFVNSVLPQISDESNRGRVSGTAWALGYWGSILCLVIVLFGFVMPGNGLFGLPAHDAINIRSIPVFVAIWMLVFSLPLMIFTPPSPRDPSAPKWNPLSGYAQIFMRVARACRREPVMLHYLISSAIYRDGLGAIFSLAGVVAAASYGFSQTEIIIFGISANLIAGVGVYLGGKADDRLGPRVVIVGGCVAVILTASVILLSAAPIVFWICGLTLSFFVGPIQSASRSLLTRLSDPGSESENFGLYATTGRALGFMGTFAFGVTVSLFQDTRMGILGVVIVMLLGLLTFLPLKLGAAGKPGSQLASAAHEAKS
ncbi:MFS transporter [Devriesea agamarum]|uniref:MFS transporter n=1 Tax=Devriesea agamarum TaxID=472569 RepID=UPI001E62B884|nr:MFS transporter [Devriesea agamarum]